jgi:hypothetical protein
MYGPKKAHPLRSMRSLSQAPGGAAILQVGSVELPEVACCLRVVTFTPGLMTRAGDILQLEPRSLARAVACPPTARGSDPGEVHEMAGLVDAELPLRGVPAGLMAAINDTRILTPWRHRCRARVSILLA